MPTILVIFGWRLFFYAKETPIMNQYHRLTKFTFRRVTG